MKQPLTYRTLPADVVPVWLIILTHPDLSEPLLISTDNGVVLSDEPRLLGTRSTFASSPVATRDFVYCGMEVVMPDEVEDGDTAASLLMDVLDSEIVSLLTSTIVPAEVKMAQVRSDTPNFLELTYSGLLLLGANGDYGAVSLQLSMEQLFDEPVPYVRFSRERFPGLFK